MSSVSRLPPEQAQRLQPAALSWLNLLLRCVANCSCLMNYTSFVFASAVMGFPWEVPGRTRMSSTLAHSIDLSCCIRMWMMSWSLIRAHVLGQLFRSGLHYSLPYVVEVSASAAYWCLPWRSDFWRTLSLMVESLIVWSCYSYCCWIPSRIDFSYRYPWVTVRACTSDWIQCSC